MSADRDEFAVYLAQNYFQIAGRLFRILRKLVSNSVRLQFVVRYRVSPHDMSVSLVP